MKNYEAFIILKPILDVDSSDNALKRFEDLVEARQGKVLKKDKLGRKRLAYEIKKFKDGFVATYQLSLDPTSLVELRRLCHMNEDFLRLILVNREGIDLNDPSIYGRERPDHRGERGGDRGDRGGEHRGDRGDRGERGERSERPRAAARD